MLNRILIYNSGGGIGDSIQLFPLILSLENIFEDFNFTVNESQNLAQLLELALKENDEEVIKDCQKKIKLLKL